MQRVGTYLILLSLLVNCGCKGKRGKTLQWSVVSDSTRYKDLYDEAKWLAYCTHVDDTARWTRQYGYMPPLYLGQFAIGYDHSKESGDTVELYFRFHYGELTCDEKALENYNIVLNGVAFSKKDRRKIYFIGQHGNFRETDAHSRYVNELQPEVVAFIKKNFHDLNPWLRNEATRRGVVQ